MRPGARLNQLLRQDRELRPIFFTVTHKELCEPLFQAYDLGWKTENLLTRAYNVYLWRSCGEGWYQVERHAILIRSRLKIIAGGGKNCETYLATTCFEIWRLMAWRPVGASSSMSMWERPFHRQDHSPTTSWTRAQWQAMNLSWLLRTYCIEWKPAPYRSQEWPEMASAFKLPGTYPEYPKLILAPCVSHRSQNSIK